MTLLLKGHHVPQGAFTLGVSGTRSSAVVLVFGVM